MVKWSAGSRLSFKKYLVIRNFSLPSLSVLPSKSATWNRKDGCGSNSEDRAVDAVFRFCQPCVRGGADGWVRCGLAAHGHYGELLI